MIIEVSDCPFCDDLDGRITELEGYLHDWLLLDERISARLKSQHGWNDEQKHDHAVDMEARAVLKEQVRCALGKGEG